MSKMRRKRRCLRQTREYWTEYCLTTQIHGVRYLSENRTWIETVFWTLVLLTCIGVTIFGMVVLYGKFKNRPLSINFATRDSPIYNIPFPAVSICWQSKNIAGFNYTDLYIRRQWKKQKLEHNIMKKLEIYTMFCTRRMHDISEEEYFGEDFFKTLQDLFPPVDQLIFNCKFMEMHYEKCSDVFMPVLTLSGICFTFNALDRSQLFRDKVYWFGNMFRNNKTIQRWSNENGYTAKEKEQTYPLRTTFGGAGNSLSFVVASYVDDYDYKCSLNDAGYRVVLHSPLEMPLPDMRFSLFSTNATADFIVVPQVTKTQESAKSLGVQGRKCFFSYERYLRYFKVYSQENCGMECLTNFTLENCACADFYMPREIGTKICASKKSACLRAAKRYRKVNENVKYETIIERSVKCNCLPLCTSVKYSSEVSQSHWNSARYRHVHKIKLHDIPSRTNNTTIHVSRLKIFFDNDEFLQLEREIIFGLSNLVSQIGGLLGLFLGASILSLVEIIYFLSLRIFCNWRLYKNWSGSANR